MGCRDLTGKDAAPEEATTVHRVVYESAEGLSRLDSSSIHLVVTSPPYPMVEMWDQDFGRWDSRIAESLVIEDGLTAFELMHQRLDTAWAEVFRVLAEGGIACINIGDAARTIGGRFQLFPSHARILNSCLAIGFQNLPNIIWRKTTNAPNKFMGSGMLPPGAYVTLEHEYVLILRKGGKRSFDSAEEKLRRSESAYFWEERNTWFSDVWFDLRGTSQALNDTKIRGRSGAFPFLLPYRLINMYSVEGDTVLDPFLGTGTTTLAAIAAGRNSIGYEIDQSLSELIHREITQAAPIANDAIVGRVVNHLRFLEEREQQEKPAKFICTSHRFGVMSRQEQQIRLRKVESVEQTESNVYRAHYGPIDNQQIVAGGAVSRRTPRSKRHTMPIICPSLIWISDRGDVRHMGSFESEHHISNSIVIPSFLFS